ncbi:hypothetical protein QEN19_003029 [Hanseniaspora menglaensis]
MNSTKEFKVDIKTENGDSNSLSVSSRSNTPVSDLDDGNKESVCEVKNLNDSNGFKNLADEHLSAAFTSPRVTSLTRDRPPENLRPDIGAAVPSFSNMSYIAKNTISKKTKKSTNSICEDSFDYETDVDGTRKISRYIFLEIHRILRAIFDVILKCILAFFYCFFAILRFFEYNYNSMKLKFYSLIYNPSNSPQLIRSDVSSLSKIPKILAAIVDYKSEEEVGGGVLGLMENSSDIVAWSLSAGIKHLYLYDHDGLLKNDVGLLRRIIYNNLRKYFGPAKVPKFAVRIPHTNQIFYNLPPTPISLEYVEKADKKISIEVILLSKVDGRETIVDLTKSMAELCKQGLLDEKDITQDLVDKELRKLVGEEPDLLLYFGPNLDLQGFPPWHIRLTELFWEHDNNDVSYTVFIRGLKEYAGSKVNVGK